MNKYKVVLEDGREISVEADYYHGAPGDIEKVVQVSGYYGNGYETTNNSVRFYINTIVVEERKKKKKEKTVSSLVAEFNAERVRYILKTE